MKKNLNYGQDQFQADRVVKTDTDIIGYNNDSPVPVFYFKGISDFTQFSLAEGQIWDTDLSVESRIKALEDALLMIL